MSRPSLAFASGALLAASLVGGLAVSGASTPARTAGPAWVAGQAVTVSADPEVVRARRLALRTDEPPSLAPPTEHWLGDDAEQLQKSRRKAWFEEFHTGGDPDLDYRSLELANGLAQIAKRNALAAAPPPPDDAPVWIERGSNNNAGRMHVAVHSDDGQTLYAGSSRGGLWRRPIDGGSWEVLGDNLYGGVHHLVLFPPTDGGSDVMLAATDGGLVHRSDDDGATWVRPSGLDTTQRVRRLIRSVTQPQTAWMVVGQWSNGWTHRLVRTLDGGRTFATLRDLGRGQPDIWLSRTGDDTTLWLAHDNQILRSDDDGESWTAAFDLPRSDFNRLELTGSEAGGPRLWVVASGSDGLRELYRIDTGSGQVLEIDTPDLNPDDSRPDELRDYWGTLNASIVDPDVFAWGGVEVFFTLDGGESFDRVNRWGEYYQAPAIYLHADNPGMDVALDGDEEVWYFSTDGGLYESRDALDTVNNLSLDGLRVSQYYDVLTSSADPSHVAAGSQDQGYQTSQRYVDAQEGLYDLEQILSGDYGHLTSSDGSHEVVYSVYPGFMLVVLGEDEAELTRPYVQFPPNESYGWLPQVVADPEDPWSVFYCARRLYRYTFDEGAATWVAQDWAGVDFRSMDGEYISALTFSPLDPSRGWLATNRGRVFYSGDKGRSWTQSTASELSGHYFYGHALVGSIEDPNVAWLGGNGYQTASVLRTTDGGRTWSPWDEGLPPTQVYGLVEADDGSGRVFASTEQTAYMRLPGAPSWVDITRADAPVTTYWSVEWLSSGVARFGTYGRGIWDYNLDPDGDGCWEGRDADRDGFTCDVDCDDTDAETFPGAVDVCDGIDRNCDPSDLDEGDADGDGYLACEECDDGQATAFPGADEVRGNDIDEDCDGKAQKGCGCSTGATGGWPAMVLLPLLALARRRRR